MRMPGFTAEESICKASRSYCIPSGTNILMGNEPVLPSMWKELVGPGLYAACFYGGVAGGGDVLDVANYCAGKYM